jgi:hypothetical protein
MSKEDLKFPVLMESIENNQIVLFTSHTDGVIIRSVGHTNLIGSSSDSFIDPANEKVWKIYNGEIILSNGKIQWTGVYRINRMRE